MPHVLTLILGFSGTFVFAVSGATVAVRRGLDIFGLMVLAVAAGNAGGITRDVLIGAVPPVALSNAGYLGISVLAGLIVYFGHGLVEKLKHPVQLFDALGLAFFAVDGTHTALAHGLSPLMAALLGMLTGIGGSIVRDILANEIPTVLRADLYALAALACAAIVAAGQVWQLPPVATAVLAMVLCVGIRFLAMRRDWHLPSSQRAHRRRGG